MIVYLLTNTVTGQSYVGQTRRTLKDRWNTHQSEARTRSKHPLQRAIMEHGPHAFTLRVLAEVGSFAAAKAAEEAFILEFATLYPAGYNVSLGFRLSPETRQKMGDARRGKALSAAHRAAVSRGNAGKPKSEAHKVALKAARRRYLDRLAANA